MVRQTPQGPRPGKRAGIQLADERDPGAGPETICLQDDAHVGFMSMLDDIVQSAGPHLERLNARRRVVAGLLARAEMARVG